MSKFLCFSYFLVLLILTIFRSPVASAWAPSRTTTTMTRRSHSRLTVAATLQRRQAVTSCPALRTSTSTQDRAFSSTVLQLGHHSAPDINDAVSEDTNNSRRSFLVQNTMRAVATITTTFLTTATASHAATPTATNDETIKNQSRKSSSSNTDLDPSKLPESESPLPPPSPWTNMSVPSFSEDDNNGAAQGATTDFSRAMQKAGKQKNVDPRTHG
jgi:nitric oxide reductase activation protein